MANPEHTEWQWARQEAAVTLQSVLHWNLSPTHWEQVREVLREMAAAVTAHAPAALRDASETLELYAPVRVETRLGDEPPEPVPGGVREQIAELVDTLRPRGANGHGEAEYRGDPEQTASGGA